MKLFFNYQRSIIEHKKVTFFSTHECLIIQFLRVNYPINSSDEQFKMSSLGEYILRLVYITSHRSVCINIFFSTGPLTSRYLNTGHHRDSHIRCNRIKTS